MGNASTFERCTLIIVSREVTVTVQNLKKKTIMCRQLTVVIAAIKHFKNSYYQT